MYEDGLTIPQATNCVHPSVSIDNPHTFLTQL